MTSFDIFNPDPKYLGPGIWFTIHTLAKNATTPTLKQTFKVFIYSLREEFPCNLCRSHIIEFLDRHPIDSFWNIKDTSGRDIGLFKYTWMFHNTVNKRLNKPQLSFESALEIYYGSTAPSLAPCKIGCKK